MKQIQIPKNGRFFVTVFPYADARICYPKTIHRTKRAVKMAKTRLAGSGGNILLCAVDGKLYGMFYGSLNTFLRGEFGFNEMVDKIVDYHEKWEIHHD